MVKLETKKITVQREKFFNVLCIARSVTNKESKLADIIPVKLFGVNGKTVDVNKAPYKKHNYKKRPCF